MVLELQGNWKKGLACDIHTLDSIYLGEDDHGHKRWDTKRSEMGQLVYDLKYGNNKSAIAKIIDLIHEKIKGIEKFEIIVPIPSTKMDRLFQPVEEIAKALGSYHKIEVINNNENGFCVWFPQNQSSQSGNTGASGKYHQTRIGSCHW